MCKLLKVDKLRLGKVGEGAFLGKKSKALENIDAIWWLSLFFETIDYSTNYVKISSKLK